MSTWKIRDLTIANQVVVAPMAGISNPAFRSILALYGPGGAVRGQQSGAFGGSFATRGELSSHSIVQPLPRPTGPGVPG